jgi:hypothetical protein
LLFPEVTESKSAVHRRAGSDFELIIGHTDTSELVRGRLYQSRKPGKERNVQRVEPRAESLCRFRASLVDPQSTSRGTLALLLDGGEQAHVKIGNI